MTFVKQNVSVKEFMMHEYIYILSKDSKGLLNVPEIFDYSAETQVMTMQLIPHMCVSDYYGEAAKNIHVDLFDFIAPSSIHSFSHSSIQVMDLTHAI